MASLDPGKKREWKSALAATEAPWVVCGLTHGAEGNASATVEGMAGLIDWVVHGQVSRLLKRGALGLKDAAVFPGDPVRRRPSFLLFPVSEGAATLAKKLRSLNVQNLALAECTFPEDFVAKLKQTLTKEGVRCTTLES